MLKARDVLNSFKSNLFPVISDTTSYSTPRGSKINISELTEILIDEIRNNEKNISNGVFVWISNPSLLAEDLLKANNNKNKQIVKQTTDSINELKNSIIKKEVPENENSSKIINIAKRILEFNQQQEGKELKILTPIQRLQRLPIALTQI